MTSLSEKIFGKKRTEKEQYAEIEEVIDQLSYKWGIPQPTIRSIIMTWLKFQKEFVKN